MDTGGLSEVAAEDLNMGVDTSSHLDVEAMSSVPWWWSVNASLEQFHPSPSSFSPFSHLPDARPLVIQHASTRRGKLRHATIVNCKLLVDGLKSACPCIVCEALSVAALENGGVTF